jgi:chromosome segregation ATPase
LDKALDEFLTGVPPAGSSFASFLSSDGLISAVMHDVKTALLHSNNGYLKALVERDKANHHRLQEATSLLRQMLTHKLKTHEHVAVLELEILRLGADLHTARLSERRMVQETKKPTSPQPAADSSDEAKQALDALRAKLTEAQEQTRVAELQHHAADLRVQALTAEVEALKKSHHETLQKVETVTRECVGHEKRANEHLAKYKSVEKECQAWEKEVRRLRDQIKDMRDDVKTLPRLREDLKNRQNEVARLVREHEQMASSARQKSNQELGLLEDKIKNLEAQALADKKLSTDLAAQQTAKLAAAQAEADGLKKWVEYYQHQLAQVPSVSAPGSPPPNTHASGRTHPEPPNPSPP